MGKILLMALIGLIIAGLVNLFMRSNTMDLIVSGLGVLITHKEAKVRQIP